MNEKKISAKVLASKSIKEFMQFAATAVNVVVEPAKMVDKVAKCISNPDFFAADEPLDWLMKQIEAIAVNHISENVKNSLTKIELGFNFSALANLTVGDVLQESELKEVSNEQ